jgi:hypothetical protein
VSALTDLSNNNIVDVLSKVIPLLLLTLGGVFLFLAWIGPSNLFTFFQPQ